LNFIYPARRFGATLAILSNYYAFTFQILLAARIKLKPNRQFGILDHDFIDSKGHNWTVFCRAIKNEDRATISWTFIRPEALSKEEFESQLLNFEMEMQGWKKTLQG
jgi:hypothetical protein